GHGFMDVGGWFTTIDPVGPNDTSIVGINASGTIVGNYQDATDTQRAFVDAGGVITTLNFSGNAGITGINDAGEIVGWFGRAMVNAPAFADINGVVETADGPAATEADVLGVTADGELYGYYNDAAYQQHV